MYTHTQRDRQSCPCTTHGLLTEVTAKGLQLPRTRPWLHLRAHGGKSILDMHTHTHTHTQAHIYIHTHIQRQAIKSIYHSRPVVCSYGEMITNTSHGTFASLARPPRQVHVRYTHTHTHTHTHTERDRSASQTTTHGLLSAVTVNLLQLPPTKYSLQLCAHSGKSISDIHKNTHKHSHTDR
jgi:hypothetical protein